jgi:hypothetical protein
LDNRDQVISSLRIRLFDAIAYRRGVEKLIKFTCENTVSLDRPTEEILEAYANGVLGLTDQEIDEIRKEVENIG